MRTRDTSENEKFLFQLIREELKSRKLTRLLGAMGVINSPYVVTLNEPIAQLLRLNTDEDFLKYDRIMDGCVKKFKNRHGFPDKEIRKIVEKFGLANCLR